MKVCLLLCPSWDVQHPPASLALLSAQLKRRGHEAKILDLNHRMFLLGRASDGGAVKNHALLSDPWVERETVRERLMAPYTRWIQGEIGRLVAEGFQVAAFSVYDTNLEMSVAVAELFKAADPDVKVVFGGPSCLTLPECLAHVRRDCVDAVVLGEADLSFPRLIDDFEKDGKLRASPGVLLRGDPSTWKEGRQPIENLDELPHADFSAYGSLTGYVGKVVHTSRGCIRQCLYCSDWREMSWRHMSGRRIFEEFAHQLGQHPDQRNFLFGDSLLNGSLSGLSALCDLMISERMEAFWHGFAIIRPDMTPSVLDKMKRAGCVSMSFGIESGSPRVLGAMNKGVDPAVNGRVLRDVVTAGIKAEVLLMVGFVGETEQDFQETLDFVARNAAGISSINTSLFQVREEMRAWDGRFDRDAGLAGLYWKAERDGNTLAVRLRRLRRLMELAQANGIPCRMQGSLTLSGLDAYEETLLSKA